ncbi:hypothetical protein [uncultured Spirosoma sp.]|uniref:hypothetical protein n=1 Tax=uncultured Spirosoma sp. TaxID=278208 RepID=UPI002587A89C|nr:hypothetical protein [uncultured Spirosoma sp.]
MKFTSYSLAKQLLIVSLLLGLSQCKKSSVDPTESNGIELTDPNEISKVMVIPGATLVQGTPPPTTNTSDTPRLSTATPDVSTISGQDGTFTINYSNVVGTITVIYIRFEDADSYFKIPLSGNSGSSGQITIPMRIPEKYSIVGSGSKNSAGRFCCFASTASAREVALCNNSFNSVVPPRPGKGAVNIDGKSYDATAVCNMDLGSFKGYGIVFGDDKFIALYNLRSGTNKLVDIVNGSKGPTDGVPCAAYLEGSNFYGGVSGTATYNGKVVSVSGVFEDYYGNSQINVSASGNCQ